MSFGTFSDNDDDLFNETSSLNTGSSSSTFRSPVDDIKSLIENTDPSDLEQIDSMLFRSKMALTLYDGSNSFIFGSTSFNRTMFNTLNQLTDGKFQYNLYADVLEESIARRIIIFDFLVSVLDEDNEKLLSDLSRVVNINIDQRFLNTYFKSFASVMNFVINQNIDLYTKVCENIERLPSQFILDRSIEDDAKNLLSSDTYINNVFTNIKQSFGHGYDK